jgi:hypothetical protein
MAVLFVVPQRAHVKAIAVFLADPSVTSDVFFDADHLLGLGFLEQLDSVHLCHGLCAMV